MIRRLGYHSKVKPRLKMLLLRRCRHATCQGYSRHAMKRPSRRILRCLCPCHLLKTLTIDAVHEGIFDPSVYQAMPGDAPNFNPSEPDIRAAARGALSSGYIEHDRHGRHTRRRGVPQPPKSSIDIDAQIREELAELDEFRKRGS